MLIYHAFQENQCVSYDTSRMAKYNIYIYICKHILVNDSARMITLPILLMNIVVMNNSFNE